MDCIFDPGLVLYLPLFELDGSSFPSRDTYGHLCTVTGAVQRPAGRWFDGTDDHINLGYNSRLDITGALTISAWINSAGGGTYSYILVRNAGDSNTSQYGLGLTNAEKPYVYIENTAWWPNSPTLISGRWYHLVFTFQSPDWKIYLNGNLAITQSVAKTLTSQNYRTLVGARDNWGGQSTFYDGMIGEILVYRRALAAQEIQRDYLMTKWRYQ